ncbi:hypothetical protein RB213_006595 [Colletotrichum asianum]
MSTASSRIPDMTDSSILLEDESFFQEAIALAEQTLKLSSGGAVFCPATRREAKSKLGMSPTSKNHKFFITERIRSDVYYDKKNLQQCFIDEAKYHDLITELCQIFREHYVLKYMDCRVEDLPVELHRLGGAKSWGQTASEQDQKSSAPPVRPPTPSTDIVERIAHLFCESAYTYGGIIQDFLQIITESTAGTRGQRDFNRYKDKLLRGEYEEVAYHIRSDRENLKTRLHRVEDAILVSKIGDAIDKKDRFLFMVHKSIWSDSMDRPDWRLYPSKEAVEMSVFQEYWEDRPRRRDDSYDSDDYPDDDPPRGLGPFGW